MLPRIITVFWIVYDLVWDSALLVPRLLWWGARILAAHIFREVKFSWMLKLSSGRWVWVLMEGCIIPARVAKKEPTDRRGDLRVKLEDRTGLHASYPREIYVGVDEVYLRFMPLRRYRSDSAKKPNGVEWWFPRPRTFHLILPWYRAYSHIRDWLG